MKLNNTQKETRTEMLKPKIVLSPSDDIKLKLNRIERRYKKMEELEQNKQVEPKNELDVPVVDRGSGFDGKLYEGKRVKIAIVKRIWDINTFPDGQTYNANSTEMMWKVFMETEPLHELDENGNFTDKLVEYSDDKKNVKNITVSLTLNLQEEIDPNTRQVVMGSYVNEITGQSEQRPNPVLSRHPKASAWAFCRKMGANNLTELKDKIVTLTTVPSKTEGDDRVFLRIVK